MTTHERALVKQFMYLVLKQLHPNWNEYNFPKMESVEYTKGDGFDGTEFEDAEKMQMAYYMHQIAREF